MTRPGLRLLLTLLLTAAVVLTVSALRAGEPLALALPSGADTLELRFPALHRLFAGPAPVAAVDSALLAALNDTADAADAAPALATARRRIAAARPAYADTASLDAKIRLLNPDRPDGTRALDPFFASLYALDADSARQEVIRVAHYGDSQIEGDRITEFLRRSFHQRFGGAGIGYLPLLEPATHHAGSRAASPNWRRYTLFLNRRKDNPYYFLSGQVFRYGAGAGPSILPDSATDDSGRKRAIAPAIARLEGQFSASSASFQFVPARKLRFERLKLLWGKASGAASVTLSVRDSVLSSGSIPADSTLHITDLGPFPQAWHGKFKPITLSFSGPSPDVYGLLVEGGPRGVQVDNFGLRGHAGHGLKRLPGPWIRQMVSQLNTKLILIQYGGNVVGYETKDFKFYEKHLIEIIERFRTWAPEASILVVSVGDVARKVGDEVLSYSTVPLILEAQRRAALATGAAFWDLERAMGGPGSIASWVNAPVPLAAADYAHFSPAGQRLVGNLLFRALMNEYAEYLARVQGSAAPPVDTTANPPRP